MADITPTDYLKRIADGIDKLVVAAEALGWIKVAEYEAGSADEEALSEKPTEVSDKPPTKEDVRKALLALSQHPKGGRKAVEKILDSKFRTDKLSGVPEDKYGELIEAAVKKLGSLEK